MKNVYMFTFRRNSSIQELFSVFMLACAFKKLRSMAYFTVDFYIHFLPRVRCIQRKLYMDFPFFFSSFKCVVDGCRCWCCCCFCNNSNKKHLAVFYYITMNRRFHSPQIRFCYNDTRVEQQLMHPQIAITKSNLILCSLQHFFMPISFCT